MNILQLTPGAGAMVCGNCLRDNALSTALQHLGHSVLMVPLYLPLTLDEPDQSAGTPIFFSGLQVYLSQKSAFFRGAPTWLRDVFAARPLLEWAAGKTAKTRPQDLGDLTLSMVRGELGNQARELDELVTWLKRQPRPDVICLSNALLLGLANRLKQELGAPLVCTLQGEDTFLDALPEPYRTQCWQTLSERAAVVDAFIAPSRYFAEVMRQHLSLPAPLLHDTFKMRERASSPLAPLLPRRRGEPVANALNRTVTPPGNAPSQSPLSSSGRRREGREEASAAATQKLSCSKLPAPKLHIVPNGINLDGYDSDQHPSSSILPPQSSLLAPSPTLGFFARQCREKGLDTLVDAYLHLRRRDRIPGLKLRIGGSCGPADEPVVEACRERLTAAGLLSEAEFCPNLDRAGKIAFLKSLSVFSVPALYGEAFGLYLLEAMAAGVPVVQPRVAAFPELIEATGGGVLCAPGDPLALAESIEAVLLNPARAQALGQAGRQAVWERFSAEAMARRTMEVFAAL